MGIGSVVANRFVDLADMDANMAVACFNAKYPNVNHQKRAKPILVSNGPYQHKMGFVCAIIYLRLEE